MYDLGYPDNLKVAQRWWSLCQDRAYL